MTDFLKGARRAKAAGDLQGAGDLLLLAGRPIEAVSMFIEGKLFGRAAETLEAQGDLRGAAELYVKAEDHRRGAMIYERLGDYLKASIHYDATGESYRAAQLAERAGETLGAAELYQKVGHLEKAAQLYLDGGLPLKAGEMFEELWLTRNREEPRHQLRTLLAPERIAEYGARAFWKAGAFDKAADFFSRAGHHERAADAFEKAGEPERAARSYRKAGKLASAIGVLERADLGSSAYELLGDLYLEHGDPLLAGEAFEKAGKLKRAAEAYESGNDSTRAAKLYGIVGEKRRAGDLFHSSGDILSAARAYEEAGLLEASGAAYEEAGDVPKAADVARRVYASLQDGRAPGGRARLLAVGKRAGDLSVAAGQGDLAGRIFEEIGLARDASLAYERAGLTAKAAEQSVKVADYERALALFRKAGIPVPRQVQAGYLEMTAQYADAARVYEECEELERAAALYEREGLLGDAARVLEAMQDHLRAAECYEAAGEPRRAGQLFQKAGLYDKAADCLERAGDLERAAYVYLLAEDFLAAADAFLKAGKSDDAVALLQKIKPGHEDYLEGCLRLGQIFFEKGLFSLALDKYHKGLVDRPADETLFPSFYNLGLTYENLERYREARECYEKILSVDFGYRDVRSRREATFVAEARLKSDSTPLPASAVAAAPAPESSRFEVKGMLESDELGVSYRAWDTVKERPVTLRRFTAPQSEPSKIERLLREATFAMKLQHANILTVYDVGEEAGVKYVATEYAEGQNLRARLEAGERLDPYRAADVIAQVALALDHAHRQGVVHRNLRPETILILTNGDVAKVRDFGFADRLTDTLKASGEKRNPLLYMAPEQILGKKIDERSDVYSLGTILFELLFGHPPFTGEDIIYQHVSRPVTFPRDAARIPDRLRRVVLRSLEKDPGRRFQSAREIADELRRTEVEPGTLIDARYEIQAEIGTGGMGKVYRARDRELDETVALKILKSEYGESSDALGRFLREIKLARKISHPNVVKVYDMGRFRGSRFISMELISGPSLDQWVRQRSRIDIDAALRIVKPILSALHAAHELGIVHRDVKPQNVLLHQGTIPKIVDFGIARGMNSEGVTLSGEVLGSPKYMSPEHIEEGTLDRRADVYAVGVLMYLLFSGREPFTGENPTAILLKHIHEPPKRPRALNPEVPDWLERVVMRCLEKDPERRYQWASEVLQDLEAQG